MPLTQNIQFEYQNDKQIREIIKSVQDIAYKINIGTNEFEYVSPYLPQILGYNNETALPLKDFLAAIHPEDTEKHKKVSNDLINNKEKQNNIEYRIKHQSGNYIWLKDKCILMQDKVNPTIILRVGILREITKQKETEQELNDTHEILASFLKNSPICAYIKEVTETESRIINASDTVHTLTSPPPTEIIGKTMHELFPPEFAKKITEDDNNVIKQENPIKIEENLNGKSFTTIKFPIKIKNRRLLAGYTIDTTEQNKIEQQKRQLQKTESLTRMAGAIAHHFNNQLQTIIMSLQLMISEAPPNSENHEILTDALQSSRMAAQMSTLMLTFLGQSNTKHEALDLSEISA